MIERDTQTQEDKYIDTHIFSLSLSHTHTQREGGNKQIDTVSQRCTNTYTQRENEFLISCNDLFQNILD